MHIFRTQPLITKLAKGEVSPQEQAAYAIASVCIWTVAFYSGLVVAGAQVWTIPSILEAVAIVGITVVGVVRCFDNAGGNKNRQFLNEFYCLSVPITTPLVLAVWICYWAITLGFREALFSLSNSDMQFAVNLSKIGADLFALLSFLAVVCVQAGIYYRLAGALHQVQVEKNDA